MAGPILRALRLTVIGPVRGAIVSVLVPVVATAFSAALSSAQQPVHDQDAAIRGVKVEHVASLVRALGHDDYRIRASADEQLARIGGKAKEQLAKAEADPDPEVRLRAREIPQQIKIAELFPARPF